MTTPPQYLVVAGRIRAGWGEIDHVVTRTNSIWHGEHHGDDWYIDALALNLHGFYAGLERLFEIIAEAVDEAKPAGADWHVALLSQMSAEIAGVRPAVITLALRARLDLYRGFRHVVRNVYTFNLDEAQVVRLVEGLPETASAASVELLAFAEFLEELAST